MLQMEVTILGRHGGMELAGKARASAKREIELVEFFIEARPDVVVCLSSVEASRAAYALGIPIACFNDFPEAEFTAKLTIPIASAVFAPDIIPARIFESMGATRVFSYRALDPIAWLTSWDLRREIDAWMGWNGHTRTVVFREQEREAAYLTGRVTQVTEAVKLLAARHSDWLFVGIPRYSPEELRATVAAPNVVVPPGVVNSIGLLAEADLFLGGGGTMNIEAAYFGTPTVCCRPLDCLYEAWLVGNRLAFRARDLTGHAIADTAEGLMGRRIDSTTLREMRFPTDDLVEAIEHLVR
jgi:predicted glycosyltransferase